jgi:hypothetical protein
MYVCVHWTVLTEILQQASRRFVTADSTTDFDQKFSIPLLLTIKMTIKLHRNMLQGCRRYCLYKMISRDSSTGQSSISTQLIFTQEGKGLIELLQCGCAADRRRDTYTNKVGNVCLYSEEITSRLKSRKACYRSVQIIASSSAL